MTKNDNLSNISICDSIYTFDNSLNSDKFDYENEIIENTNSLKLNEYCKTQTKISEYNNDKKSITCEICFNNKIYENSKEYNTDSYIILSCNHTFHISCLIEIQFNDINKFHIIDSEYINSIKCPVCNSTLEIEELLFLHSKFLANTKYSITDYNESIKELELKVKNLKNELRNCYEYKNKLQQERERSKEIITNLTMLI
jgi:hypothetical protein